MKIWSLGCGRERETARERARSEITRWETRGGQVYLSGRRGASNQSIVRRLSACEARDLEKAEKSERKKKRTHEKNIRGHGAQKSAPKRADWRRRINKRRLFRIGPDLAVSMRSKMVSPSLAKWLQRVRLHASLRVCSHPLPFYATPWWPV